MKVLLNTSTTSSHHLVTSKHEDVVITDRVNDLDKCLNWDEEDNENLFENSNVKESDVILS